jgi:hypothetical protein
MIIWSCSCFGWGGRSPNSASDRGFSTNLLLYAGCDSAGPVSTFCAPRRGAPTPDGRSTLNQNCCGPNLGPRPDLRGAFRREPKCRLRSGTRETLIVFCVSLFAGVVWVPFCSGVFLNAFGFLAYLGASRPERNNSEQLRTCLNLFRTTRTISEHLQTIVEQFRTTANIPEHSRTLPRNPEHCRTVPTIPNDRTCSDFFGLVRTCSDMFGHVRSCSDLFEHVRVCSDMVGNIRICFSDLFGIVCSDIFGLDRNCWKC